MTNMKVITVFLLAGVLFFSCAFGGPDAYGTLVIALPGSGSARDLNDNDFQAYIKTLKYRVVCKSAVNELTSKPVSYGKNASISLSPGEWFVTVEVLDMDDGEPVAASEPRGPVAIRAGKTTPVNDILIKISMWPSNGKWDKYGLAGLEQPAGAKVIYITEDVNEGKNYKGGKIHREYGLRDFNDTDFSKFFAVVFEGADDIHNNLLAQVQSLLPNQNAATGAYYDNSRTRVIDLEKNGNYIIIAVRQGKEGWYITK